MEIEKIEWVDSFGVNSDWTEFDKISNDIVITCTSVGYVIKETETYIIVVPHLHGDTRSIGNGKEISASGCGDMAIPKCSITERYVLTKDKTNE